MDDELRALLHEYADLNGAQFIGDSDTSSTWRVHFDPANGGWAPRTRFIRYLPKGLMASYSGASVTVKEDIF